MEPNKHEINKVLRICNSGTGLPALQEFRSRHPKFSLDRLNYPASGDTIFHVAAQKGDAALIAELISSGQFSPNCRNKDNKTPLHEGCQFGHLEVVRQLLTAGADVNALKKGDWTPLMLACTKLHKGGNLLIDTLIINGAATNFQNKDGWTALHLAARSGDPDVYYRLLSTESKQKTDYTKRSNNGNTVLHIAALHGNWQLFKALAMIWREGIEIKNNQGNTSLHEAVMSKNLESFKEVASWHTNTNIHYNYKSPNLSGMNCLHLAAYIGHREIFNYLLTLTFDVHSLTNSGQNVLHLAAHNNMTEMYTYCLSLGVASVRDNFGRLPQDYLINKID